jgi:ATP-dependent protease ClpP protease subunit
MFENHHKIYLFDSPMDSQTYIRICKEIDEAGDNKSIKEILIVINSGGGSNPIALFDYIQISPTPVDTLVCGDCSSAAVTVLQSGRRRYATKNSTILIHSGTTGVPKGPTDQLDTMYRNTLKQYDLMRSAEASRVGLSLKDYKELLTHDNLMTAQEALEKNFIDQIV